jgi:hypothetical protein
MKKEKREKKKEKKKNMIVRNEMKSSKSKFSAYLQLSNP